MPNLTIRNRQFPSNNDLSGGFSGSTPPSTTQNTDAANFLALEDPSNPGEFFNYKFLFWNLTGATNAGIYTSTSLSIQVGSNPVIATAWYLQIGGSGGGVPTVWTQAFDVAADAVLPESPIQSVVPSGAWAGGSSVTVQTTGGPVDIDAKNAAGGKPFKAWQVVFGALGVLGDHLTAGQSVSGLAIATYAVSKGVGPKIDPTLLELVEVMQGIKDKIRQVYDPSPEDLIRLSDRLKVAEAAERATESLDQVITGVEGLSLAEQRSTLVAIEAQLTKLRTAQALLADAIKQGPRAGAPGEVKKGSQ